MTLALLSLSPCSFIELYIHQLYSIPDTTPPKYKLNLSSLGHPLLKSED